MQQKRLQFPNRDFPGTPVLFLSSLVGGVQTVMLYFRVTAAKYKVPHSAFNVQRFMNTAAWYLCCFIATIVVVQSFQLPPDTARSSGYGVDDSKIAELLDEKLSPCKYLSCIRGIRHFFIQ